MCFNGNHNAQLWILDSSAVNSLQCFVCKAVSVYAIQNLSKHLISPKVFKLQTKRIYEIVTACFHSGKSLASESLIDSETEFLFVVYINLCVLCSSFCFHRMYA